MARASLVFPVCRAPCSSTTGRSASAVRRAEGGVAGEHGVHSANLWRKFNQRMAEGRLFATGRTASAPTPVREAVAARGRLQGAPVVSGVPSRPPLQPFCERKNARSEYRNGAHRGSRARLRALSNPGHMIAAEYLALHCAVRALSHGNPR